ncbi:MAG: hypothetical protein KAH84_03425 [Thiomargarita sp.]|nr:hypothetical protein [Thiomargarita sp.]
MEIVSKLHQLPENSQKKVLNYIEFLINADSQTNNSIPIKKLDPFTHSTPIEYQTNENLTDVKPFAQIKDSAKYGKELREKAWNRK